MKNAKRFLTALIHRNAQCVTWTLVFLIWQSAQAELCGNNTIFVDGYEPPSFVAVDQLSGGVQSPGLTQSISGPAMFSVSITSPTSGSTISSANVDVVGTWIGPLNTGIVVNGVAGYTVNGSFLVPNVPLNSGANTLTVTATKLTGATTTASINVTQSAAAPLLTLEPDRSVGFAPFTINFTTQIGTLPGNATVQSVALDYNGDNVDDYTGAAVPATPPNYTYRQPGIYRVRFKIIDSNNVTYITQRTLLIQDLAVQRGIACDVYAYLKDRLTAASASETGNAFHSSVKSDYVNLFTSLGNAMPAIAQAMGVIVAGQLSPEFADLLIVRDNPDHTRSGFPLRLTRGADGVWRISEM